MVALAILAAVLVVGLAGQLRSRALRPSALLGRGLLLAALLLVPVAMWHASDPTVYPPINPDSGGPTGASLMASSLGVVAIFLVTPCLLGLAQLPGSRLWPYAALLGVHGAAFALVGGGDHSHRELPQMLAVASLLLWLPALVTYLRRFAWPPGTRRWQGAFLAWWGALVVTATITFAPAVLDRLKFTNGLVAHAHLAMAGMASAFCALVLATLARGTAAGQALAARRPFVLWQVGCVAQLAALGVLGALEGSDPGVVMLARPASTGLYAARWLGGALMLAASLRWLGGAVGEGKAAP